MKTGYKVEDVMTNTPITVSKETPLRSAASLMRKYNVNSLLVMENGSIAGILTDEDFVRKIAAEGKFLEGGVAGIMETNLVTLSPGRDVYEAIVLMRDHNIRQLPIVQDGTLVGFLTLNDILKIQPELFELMVDAISLREQERKLKLVGEPPEM